MTNVLPKLFMSTNLWSEFKRKVTYKTKVIDLKFKLERKENKKVWIFMFALIYYNKDIH